jgi:hypothetical protein
MNNSDFGYIVFRWSLNCHYDNENWLHVGDNCCLINCRNIHIFVQNYYTEDSVIINI